jgi:hypothetical protein
MEVGLKVCECIDWAQVCDNWFQLGNQEQYTVLASSTRRGSYADQLSNSHILYRQEEWLMSTHRLWHWLDNENSENERSDMMSAVSNPVCLSQWYWIWASLKNHFDWVWVRPHGHTSRTQIMVLRVLILLHFKLFCDELLLFTGCPRAVPKHVSCSRGHCVL